MNTIELTEAERARYHELLEMAVDFARLGETSRLAAMLEAGLNPNLRNAKGHSLLMLAAYHGHVSTTAMLLEHGAEVDARNDRGQTPLGGAAFKGHDEVVRTLLAHGADAKADQGFGLTAAAYARMFGRFKTASIIRQHTKAPRPRRTA